MDIFTLVARLTLDSSQFKSGIKQSQGLFSTLGSKVSAGTVAMGNLVSQGVGKAVGALVNFGKESVSTGISFEAAMSQVAAISGTTGTKLDALVDKAMEMGAVTKFSATESAEAFKYMAMAGWDADQMMAGIAGTMNLAAASGESLGTVSDIVTDVLTAMGKSAADAGHFADVLAAASSSANTNVGMMGETFKYAATLSGRLGYSIEDLAIATGLMANAGIKGSQAGTSLRSLLTRFAKPVKDSKKAMSDLGLSITESDGSMRSLRDIMTDMRGAFADLTESQQASYAAMLAGQEGMSGLLAIIGASDDDFSRLIENIDNSAGAAMSMADIMMHNVGGSLEQMHGALETLGLTLFEDFKKPLQVAIDYTTGLFDTLTQAYKEGGLIGLASSAGEMVAEVVSNIAEATPKIAGAAGAFLGSFGKEITEQAPSILASTSAGVADTIISGINAAFGTNIPDWNTLSTKLSGMITGGLDKVTGFFGKGEDSDGFLSKFVGGIFGNADSEVGKKESQGWFDGILSGLGSGVKDFFSKDGNSSGILSGIVKGIFSGSDDGESKGFFSGLFDKVFGGIGDFFNDLNPFKGIAESFESIATNGETAIANIEELLGTEIDEDFTQPISNMADWWTTISTNIKTAFDNLQNFIKIKVPPEFARQIIAMQNVFDAIMNATGNALVYFSSFIITEVPQALLNSFDSIKSKWEAIQSAIEAALSALNEFISKDSYGFHSGGGSSRKGHAVGLDYVPYDNYSANLHRGEAVLTRAEAEEWRAGESGNGGGRTIIVNQYINSEAQTAADLMREARWEQERGVLMAYV